MKRVLSLALSLVMLLSVTGGLGLTAYAGDTYYETEDNDDYSSADYVPVNSTIYGVCRKYDRKYDYDWYKFTLSSPAKVNVQFSFNRADADGAWSVYLYKYDGNGDCTKLDHKYVYVYDGSYTFSSLGLPAGTYFVEVRALEGRGYSASAWGRQYSITPKCSYVSNWETEFNDEYTSADPLSMGETRYGVCLSYDDSDLYDCDWYKFTLNSPASVSVTFTHTKASANGDWDVYLYKYTGNGGYSRVTDEDVYVSDGNYTFPTQGLSAGTYFVRVCGYNSACGRQYGVTVNYSVGKPGKFRVSSRGSNSLKLAWNKPAGATGYQLQRKSGNSYKALATVKGTSYTHKSLSAGAGYTYRVRAYRTVGGKNYYSGWAYMTAYTKPATPNLTGLRATKSGHKIKATWKKVGGSASGYQIYWAKDKNFKKVVSKTTVSGQKKTSYTGKNFTKGKRYYVKVRAYKTVNGNKIYGAWSNVRNVKAK